MSSFFTDPVHLAFAIGIFTIGAIQFIGALITFKLNGELKRSTPNRLADKIETLEGHLIQLLQLLEPATLVRYMAEHQEHEREIKGNKQAVAKNAAILQEHDVEIRVLKKRVDKLEDTRG